MRRLPPWAKPRRLDRVLQRAAEPKRHRDAGTDGFQCSLLSGQVQLHFQMLKPLLVVLKPGPVDFGQRHADLRIAANFRQSVMMSPGRTLLLPRNEASPGPYSPTCGELKRGSAVHRITPDTLSVDLCGVRLVIITAFPASAVARTQLCSVSDQGNSALAWQLLQTIDVQRQASFAVPSTAHGYPISGNANRLTMGRPLSLMTDFTTIRPAARVRFLLGDGAGRGPCARHPADNSD